MIGNVDLMSIRGIIREVKIGKNKAGKPTVSFRVSRKLKVTKDEQNREIKDYGISWWCNFSDYDYFMRVKWFIIDGNEVEVVGVLRDVNLYQKVNDKKQPIPIDASSIEKLSETVGKGYGIYVEKVELIKEKDTLRSILNSLEFNYSEIFDKKTIDGLRAKYKAIIEKEELEFKKSVEERKAYFDAKKKAGVVVESKQLIEEAGNLVDTETGEIMTDKKDDLPF